MYKSYNPSSVQRSMFSGRPSAQMDRLPCCLAKHSKPSGNANFHRLIKSILLRRDSRRKSVLAAVISFYALLTEPYVKYFTYERDILLDARRSLGSIVEIKGTLSRYIYCGYLSVLNCVSTNAYKVLLVQNDRAVPFSRK